MKSKIRGTKFEANPKPLIFTLWNPPKEARQQAAVHRTGGQNWF